MIDATLLSYGSTTVNMHQSYLKFWIKYFENFCFAMLTLRAVQRLDQPDPPAPADRTRSAADRSDFSGGRQRVCFSKTRF